MKNCTHNWAEDQFSRLTCSECGIKATVHGFSEKQDAKWKECSICGDCYFTNLDHLQRPQLSLCDRCLVKEFLVACMNLYSTASCEWLSVQTDLNVEVQDVLHKFMPIGINDNTHAVMELSESGYDYIGDHFLLRCTCGHVTDGPRRGSTTQCSGCGTYYDLPYPFRVHCNKSKDQKWEMC